MGGDDDPFGVCALVGCAENAEVWPRSLLVFAPVQGRVDDDLVAFGQALHSLADLRDDPGTVRAEDDGKLHGPAPADPPIPPVERRGDEVDTDLVGAGRRIGNLGGNELLRPPEAAELYGLHLPG